MLVESDLTYRQIAAELGVGYPTVHVHVKEIYGQERVHSRTELRAAAGAGPYRRPVTARQIEKAARRRAVKGLLGRGFTRKAVARRMGVSLCTVYRDAQAMGLWKEQRRRKELADLQIPSKPMLAR
jgi:DNA-binding NarL/FixJ family response regulator